MCPWLLGSQPFRWDSLGATPLFLDVQARFSSSYNWRCAEIPQNKPFGYETKSAFN